MAMKYMKINNLEEKEKIDKSIFIEGDCNQQIKQTKKTKETDVLNPWLNYCDPTDIFSMLHSLTTEYSLFPSTLRHFLKTEQILVHKSKF